MVCFDPCNWVLLFFFHSGEYYLGYTRSELGGISWYQLIHWNYMREAQSKHRLSNWFFPLYALRGSQIVTLQLMSSWPSRVCITTGSWGILWYIITFTILNCGSHIKTHAFRWVISETLLHSVLRPTAPSLEFLTSSLLKHILEKNQIEEELWYNTFCTK